MIFRPRLENVVSSMKRQSVGFDQIDNDVLGFDDLKRVSGKTGFFYCQRNGAAIVDSKCVTAIQCVSIRFQS